jgi:hypothetical protein
MRFRALALVLSLACLLAGPRAFAGKHKDDSDKESDKKATTQKKTEKAAPSQPQSNNQHGSSGQSHSGSSGSTSSGTHEHSGGAATSTQGTTEHAHHAAPATVHDANEATHHPGYHAPATVKTDERTPGYHHGTHVEEHHAAVNREHLHERMQAHPTVEARHQAYERYRTERAQFTRHAPVIHFVPAHRVVLTHIRIVPTTYHYRRTVFYDEYGWRAPVYVYSYYPRYGLWDATFLMFALDHIADEQYAMMFYHHQREEDMQRWMADSERLAADNQELRDKLDAMKVQMAKLEENGLETDPSYVPPDAQDVALSPEVIDKLTSSN